MTPDEKTIWNIIRNAQGRGSAIKARDITLFTKISERQVRSIVRQLRVVFHCPIGSITQEPAGYYLCITPEELQESTKIWWNFGMKQLFAVSRIRKYQPDEFRRQVALSLDTEISKPQNFNDTEKRDL